MYLPFMKEMLARPRFHTRPGFDGLVLELLDELEDEEELELDEDETLLSSSESESELSTSPVMA